MMGDKVGVERLAAHARRVSVARAAPSGAHLVENMLVAADDAGKVHQLA